MSAQRSSTGNMRRQLCRRTCTEKFIGYILSRRQLCRRDITHRAKGVAVANLPAEIAEMFLEEANQSPHISPQMIGELRALMSKKRSPKADDLVEIFASQAGGEVE
jgi:hypothetical protein